MVKKTVCAAVTAALIFCVGEIPGWILGNAQTIPVAAVTQEEYRPFISAVGALEAGERYDMVLSGAYCVAESFAALGNRVAAGDVLARLEPAAGSVYSVAGGGVPQLPAGLEGLAEEYGVDVSALLGGAQPSAQIPVGESMLVRAPVDGILLSDILPEGSVAVSGATLCTLQREDALCAVVQVAENRISALSPGCEAVLTLSGGETLLYGKVGRIYPAAEKTLSGTTYSTTVRVEVELAEAPSWLRAGSTVSALLYTDAPRSVPVVPYEAVLQQGSTEYVWTIEDGEPVRQEIVTGWEFADRVEVTAGLSGGEAVLLLDGEDPGSGRKLFTRAEARNA